MRGHEPQGGVSGRLGQIHRHALEDEERTASRVVAVPGLDVRGLPWLSKLHSSFLSGVGDDAAVLADHSSARR